MTPLNGFCSNIKANSNYLCSSLLFVEMNEKFLGFELKKTTFLSLFTSGQLQVTTECLACHHLGLLINFIDKVLLLKQLLLFSCSKQ